MTQELISLAHRALQALITQKPIEVTHPTGKAPEGYPLPIVRNKTPDAAGAITQSYRPIAILEYIDKKLTPEVQAPPTAPPLPQLPTLPPPLPKL